MKKYLKKKYHICNRHIQCKFVVILDAPACSRKGQLVYYAGIGESLKFVCHVNAYPKNNLSFKWTLTRSNENDAKSGNEPSSGK